MAIGKRGSPERAASRGCSPNRTTDATDVHPDVRGGSAASKVLAAVTQPADADRAKSRYQKLQPRWCGLSKDEIAAHQCRRLYEAMVEIAATRGYPATTIKAACALAGV